MKTINKKSASKSGKFSFVNELHGQIPALASVTRSGEVKIKRKALKDTIEGVFNAGVLAAASGERVKFPVIGTLVRKDVPARKAAQGKNPFTGEPMTIKARKESKKPRWSFPRAMKETFGNKKHW
ncbi:MAG TPA: HU family DNA-binding protein [Bdellovibrionota bacterium]|jgi:nucleoid DNA-binding protein|nr:HU family DNA-binding protein [Bdellovibrionota bacterium]